MITETVRLVINGQSHEGWLDVRVTAGIERQARDFTLSVTDRWPGSNVARRVKPGDMCELYFGNDKVLTGYVDATPISYDASSVSVSVSGRSKTADLVDCSAQHSSGQWRNVAVVRIAQELAEPYGIKVIAEVDAGRIAEHQLDPGESVFESIDRLLTQKALLATDNGDGNQVLTRGGQHKASSALVLGENILSCSATLDFKERYSDYICKGQRAGNDQDFGAAASQMQAGVSDSGVTRHRVIELRTEGQSDLAACRDRVRWEAAYRAGKSYEATYVVHGWRQADGALWQPNMLVHVRDGLIGFDLELLISEVEYSQGEGGTQCTLKVAPAAAFALQAEVPKPKGKKGKAKKGFTLAEGETLVEFK